MDKIAPRVLYSIVIGVWSLFTCLQGTASTVWQLVLYRLGVGASEVPSYPMNNRIITSWLPERERATAVGVYISGQYVGLAFLAPVLVWLQAAFGWRFMFYVTGGIGVIWALGFWLLYRDPLKSRANAAELSLIREGGGRLEWKSAAKNGESRETDEVPMRRFCAAESCGGW
ncbi:D-galactonate transporter [Sodalis praecaptivus]